MNSPRHCTHRENESGEPHDSRLQRLHGPHLRRRSDLLRRSRWQSLSRQPGLGCTLLGPLSAGLPEHAGGVGTENLWPLGELAVGNVGKPVGFLRGAIGAFEGIVTEGGVQFAEGWACDPDFSGA